MSNIRKKALKRPVYLVELCIQQQGGDQTCQRSLEAGKNFIETPPYYWEFIPPPEDLSRTSPILPVVLYSWIKKDRY